MRTPLQLAARNVELSDVTSELVHQSVEKLETFYPRITSCRVMIDVPQRFPSGSAIVYSVRIDLRVPGEDIVIRRQAHPELLTAIQNAFAAARRRLQDHARRIRRPI